MISRLPFDELRETAGKVIYTIIPCVLRRFDNLTAGEAQEDA